MNLNAIRLFLFLVFLNVHYIAKSQVPNFPYSLTLFNDVLPLLDDSSRAIIGINHRLNDYKAFDGNVVQLGLRTKPFYDTRNFLSRFEAGLLINGYFHKKFYWVNNFSSDPIRRGSILDQATAGHEIILFFNQKFSFKGMVVNIAAAPRLNLIFGNSIERNRNGQYFYDNEYFLDSKDYFGWVTTLNLKYKNIEGWASYQHNVIEQSYIDWGPSAFENTPSYLLDPSKTYFFKTFLSWTRHSVYNVKYGIAYNVTLRSSNMRIYSFATSYYVGSGLTYTKKRFTFNPEYSSFPTFLSTYRKITGHQIGAILSYQLRKGFVPHWSLQFSKATDFSPLRSNLGVQYKF